jgi:YggT family protein
MEYKMDAISYLLDFAFNALLMILIMRVWLQLVKADFYNPLSQFIVKASNPLVIPLRRFVPGLGGIDLATVLLAYVVASGKFFTIALINSQAAEIPTVLYFYLGLLVLIKQVGLLFFVMMMIMAIMSWVMQGYNPTQAVLQQLTEPLLRPIRQVVPNMGGLDLSFIAAFLLLNVMNILLAENLPYWAIV